MNELSLFQRIKKRNLLKYLFHENHQSDGINNSAKKKINGDK